MHCKRARKNNKMFCVDAFSRAFPPLSRALCLVLKSCQTHQCSTSPRIGTKIEKKKRALRCLLDRKKIVLFSSPQNKRALRLKLLSFSIKAAAAAATRTREEEEEEESVVYQSSSSEFVFRRLILFLLFRREKKGYKKNRIGEEPARAKRE